VFALGRFPVVGSHPESSPQRRMERTGSEGKISFEGASRAIRVPRKGRNMLESSNLNRPIQRGEVIRDLGHGISIPVENSSINGQGFEAAQGWTI
jgi:hypothetical protein